MKWQTKNNGKRYVGYALFLFLSYNIGNAAAVVSTMTLQPEKVEKEMKTVAITFDDGRIRNIHRNCWTD